MGKKKNIQLVKLGKQIRTLRVKQGFTQENFAAEAELDRAYYGSVERGERNISILNLIRIASVLNVEVGDLIPPMKDIGGSGQ